MTEEVLKMQNTCRSRARSLLEEKLSLGDGQSSQQQSVGRSGFVRRSFVLLPLELGGKRYQDVFLGPLETLRCEYSALSVDGDRRRPHRSGRFHNSMKLSLWVFLSAASSLGSPLRSSHHPWFSCLLSKYLPRNPTLTACFRIWWNHRRNCRCEGEVTFY